MLEYVSKVNSKTRTNVLLFCNCGLEFVKIVLITPFDLGNFGLFSLQLLGKTSVFLLQFRNESISGFNQLFQCTSILENKRLAQLAGESAIYIAHFLEI
jgi:hypothetical protein